MTKKRFIRKGYKIWDTWKDEEVYELNYFYEVDIMCDRMNELVDENEQLKSENDSYKNMFFEIVETALTDKNCRELYCKGILDIFAKATSLNQARDMIKEHLND